MQLHKYLRYRWDHARGFAPQDLFSTGGSASVFTFAARSRRSGERVIRQDVFCAREGPDVAALAVHRRDVQHRIQSGRSAVSSGVRWISSGLSADGSESGDLPSSSMTGLMCGGHAPLAALGRPEAKSASDAV
jgi:hypothetical protein